MAWYSDWFGESYLLVYSHRSAEEAAFEVELVLNNVNLRSTSLILDTACGWGRHVAEFRRRGFHALGVDLSPTLLLRARSFGDWFLRADMRFLPFPPQTFELLASFFTSFGYFARDIEHLNLLHTWHSALKTGGVLVLDYLNRDYVLSALESESIEDRETVRIRQSRRFDEAHGRINKKIEILHKADGRLETHLESVRVYSLTDLETMLRETRFALRAVYGDSSGAQFSASESNRLIVFAEAV